jgi:hypothetical protein
MAILSLMLAVSLVGTSVPNGRCILVNGSLGIGEWTESAALRLDTDTEILFHKDDENLFLAITFRGARHTGVDLYIHSGGGTRMLHVSSALGEKVLEDNRWSDFKWGQNDWWSANQIGSIYEEGQRRFLEPEVFEFQIDRRGLGANIRLFIHLKRPEKLLPSGASAEDKEEWIRLKLE